MATSKKQNKYEKYWKYPGSIWKTESSWWSWIRSSLRKSWNRHPVKIAKLNSERIKIPNTNVASQKRFPEVWGGECSCCKGIFPLSGGKREGKGKVTLQVDHIKEAGSLSDVEHLQRFVQRLFVVSLEDVRLICSVCNKTLDLAAKMGVTFQEATCEREAIAIVKSKGDKAWLLERDILPATAQANRRKQIAEQLKKEIK